MGAGEAWAHDASVRARHFNRKEGLHSSRVTATSVSSRGEGGSVPSGCDDSRSGLRSQLYVRCLY
jgi:hypothetical protein